MPCAATRLPTEWSIGWRSSSNTSAEAITAGGLGWASIAWLCAICRVFRWNSPPKITPSATSRMTKRFSMTMILQEIPGKDGE